MAGTIALWGWSAVIIDQRSTVTCVYPAILRLWGSIQTMPVPGYEVNTCVSAGAGIRSGNMVKEHQKSGLRLEGGIQWIGRCVAK